MGNEGWWLNRDCKGDVKINMKKDKEPKKTCANCTSICKIQKRWKNKVCAFHSGYSKEKTSRLV